MLRSFCGFLNGCTHQPSCDLWFVFGKEAFSDQGSVPYDYTCLVAICGGVVKGFICEVLGVGANVVNHGYNTKVQHLIEKCIQQFHMTKEECMEALSNHANIKPVITSTVWKELEKENKEFFEAYSKSREDRMSQEQVSQMIHKMIQGSEDD